MAKLVFRLNGVEDDEADAIRDLLTTNDIAFYETDAGRWGLSVAAIWLTNDEHYLTARQLIDAYQDARQQAQQGLPVETLAQRCRRKPATFLLSLIAIAAILYISVAPYF